MKNVKYLGFVGLGCALLLTGCGGSGNKLTCTVSQDGITEKAVTNFDSKGEKAIEGEAYFSIEIPNGASNEEIEQNKTFLEKHYCSDEKFDDCKVKVKGNSLELHATFSEKGLEAIGSKEEAKKRAESNGATCK